MAWDRNMKGTKLGTGVLVRLSVQLSLGQAPEAV
jgi:hypothetical protein